MKTFQNLDELHLSCFIVLQHITELHDGIASSRENRYDIFAERFEKEQIGNDSETMYRFYVGDDEIASVYSPHFVCDERFCEIGY